MRVWSCILRDFDYNLPEELIAQHPAARRDESRLMVLHRKTGAIEHRLFPDLLDYLDPGDTLVLNNSRVIRARLLGNKITRGSQGAKVELLLVKEIEPNLWECMTRPAKKLQPGTRVLLCEGALRAEIVEKTDQGCRIVSFKSEKNVRDLLDTIGLVPLPPYIKRDNPEEEDGERYQTIYAEKNGSVAAPTAGLHFTRTLLKQINEKGIKTPSVTLHIGPGTFKPVTQDDILKHKMHSEFFSITDDTAQQINRSAQNGGKIIAVGTTTARALESAAAADHRIKPTSAETDIFIYPGYRFQIIDRLLTNFHLPRSTLLMLVAAFAGHQFLLQAYSEAIKGRYRFYSYGDAMLII